MYKVMIVDDEPTVRNGLKAVIPWETYGFEVVVLAKDGQTALEMCKAQSFDLIISDIRMPGMDGLQLIKQIRSLDQRVKCIILTGYADFDYAKKAIKYSVASYLLKPIDEDELIPVLVYIKQDLDKEKQVKKLTIVEDERNREAFILSNLSNNNSNQFSVEERERLKDKFGISWDKYCVLLIRIEERNQEIENIISMKQDIKEMLSDDRGAVVFVHESYIGILLDCTSYKSRTIQMLYQNIRKVMKVHQINYTVALGNCVNSLCKMKDSYHMALSLIQNKFFFPKDELLVKGKELISIDNRDAAEQIEMKDIIDKLYFSIEIGELGKLETILNEIPFIKSDIQNSEETLKKRYVYALNSVVTKIQKSNQNQEKLVINISSKVLEIYEQNNMEDLKCIVGEIIQSITNEMDYDQTDDQLKKLIILIDTKYNENLKLEKLAELFNYNSAYLGKLFKSHTGEYFNTYLDKVRIKNAKRHLLDGLKVYRVAEIVGYKNVDYFHSKFKKYEGISPSAYKRKHTADE